MSSAPFVATTVYSESNPPSWINGSGRFTLDLGHPTASEGTVSVTDIIGVVVMQRTNARGKSACEIDLTKQPSGAYTASIVIDGTIVTRTFVVQR